ncbi:MAG TPA: lipase family protein [Thermoanaerobaculia bacterium]|jgi:hypothetical protein|nr:lipase family protein [Thermoanaerobaculia bacterium]
MKISVAPPFSPPRSLSGAAAPATPAAPEHTDPLAFSGEITFAGDSTIDEAAVALVDLSVLVYSPLATIREVFSKLGVEPAAIDAVCDRGPDFAWLAGQSRVRAFAAALKLDHTRRAQPERPDWLLQQLRTTVDIGIAAEPEGLAEESASLARARAQLAEYLRRDLGGVVVTDAEIGRDWRNRPPRVLAFRHGVRAYIAFRGSATWLDWRRNAMSWPGESLPLRHRGFEKTWGEVRKHVESWLAQATRELGSKPIVHLGGHSLGGALATLAAVDLAVAGYPVARVVTIGSPRVGGRMFRRLYASTPAAPDAAGARSLVQVTTRFVHGTDAVTVLPPWPFTVHVVPARHLEAADHLVVEDFVGQGPFDTSDLLALLGLWTARPATVAIGGLAPAKPVARLSLWRRVVTQVLLWVAMYFPGIGWLRAIPLLPAIFEQTRVSFGQHRSARYWTFLPPSILRRTFSAVVAPPARKPATMPPGKLA